MPIELERLLHDLNPPQREAVTAGDGPLLVLAGAGSGKTRVIAHRIANLIGVRGVDPRHLLAVTFTNKAAGEMARRVEALLEPVGGRPPLIATFHAACVRILRQHIRHIGYPSHFTIYDEDDRLAVVKEAMRERDLDERALTATALVQRISAAKNQMLSVDDVEGRARGGRDEQVARVFRRYQERMAAAGAVDFDDLLLLTVRLFEEAPEALAWYRGLWRHVLVDEYQDTNRAQYRIIRRLTSEHRNICVVGDPDQCLVEGTLVQTPDGLTPIERIREGQDVVAAAGWGSTGRGRVEAVNRTAFEGLVVRIKTDDGRELRATPNHMVFARNDPEPNLYHVCLMYQERLGYRVGVTHGVRARGDGADRLWILATCDSLANARHRASYFSAQYGLPPMVSPVRGRRLALSQDHVDRLDGESDTRARAQRLMADLRLFPDDPHHRPGAITRLGVWPPIVHFTMFGDPRPSRWHAHRIRLVSADERVREAVSLVAQPRRGKRGTWRIETSRTDYDKGIDLARQLSEVADLLVVRRAHLTPGKAFPFMPASHVRPGMMVPVLEGGQVREARVASVDFESYRGFVYDLTVQNLRNYAAGGLVVHNSVYRWRGADIRNILDFENDYPGTRVIRLEQNYRSTRRVLALAAGVIANNRARKEKTLWTENPEGEPAEVYRAWDEHEEANFVAQSVLRLRGREVAYEDVAVFYRTNAQSRVMEDALRRAGIPYVIVGSVRFYERKEIKDTLAYLRLLVNPADDVAFRRAIQAPNRGIGRATLARLDEVAERERRPLLAVAAEPPGDLTGKPRRALPEFAAMLAGLAAQRAAHPLPAFVDLVLEASGYRRALKEERAPEAEARLENLEELIAAAEDHERSQDSGLEGFLDGVALVSDVDEWKDGTRGVTLMTLHSAKGLEFGHVFLTGLEEGIFPHARAVGTPEDVEEERRLCYVGITRAKERLFLSYALHRRIHGYGLGEPSRFLLEMPEEHLSLLNAPRAEPPLAVSEPVAAEDEHWPLRVGARVRHARWGEGLVVGVEREGAETIVTVGFASVGRKKLSLQYAQLEEL